MIYALRMFAMGIVAGALAGLTPAFAIDQPATADSRVTLIYISAWDCPPCIEWGKSQKPKFEASQVRSHVAFREIEAYSFRRINEDGIWPEDLRWIRDELGLRSGAPRWIVVNGDKILLQGLGLGDWGRKVVPLLHVLTLEK